MIRTNLSTRPFYNDRAVNLWIVLLAVLVVSGTIFNISRARSNSGSNTELALQASRDEERAADLRRTAAELRASLDRRQIDAVSLEARQANDLIDRRTFSWTALFNRFEATLPAEVRITAVRPTLDRDRKIVLNVTVLGRTVNDIQQFMAQLDETGVFKDLFSTQDRPNEDDQIESTLEMIYMPEAAKP
jgi:Tfp pilus assembly protein PilN